LSFFDNLMVKLKEMEYHYANINELLALFLASLSLAVAFIVNFLFSIPYYGLLFAGILALISIAVAVLAVIPHELAHRQMARRFGCRSRFILSFRGFLATLLINLLNHFLGFLVFFSGYTGINCIFGGNFDNAIQGKTAAAGPATNLVIAVISEVMYYLVPPLITSPVPQIILGYFFLELANFNAYVAFFNLIPFWVLDGLKVIRWNFKVWLALLIPSLVLTFIVPFYHIIV